MEIVYLATGIVIGMIVVFFFFRNKNQRINADCERQIREKEKLFEQGKTQAEKEGMLWEERYVSKNRDYEEQKAELEKKREQNLLLNTQLEKTRTEYTNLQKQSWRKYKKNSLLNLRILPIKYWKKTAKSSRLPIKKILEKC